MTLIDALAQPRMLLACLVFGVLNLLLMLVEQRLLIAASNAHITTGWLMERIYLPLARIACILIFIALAYPALFGFSEAPAIGTLLGGGERRTSSLINLTFILSLLLPFIPLLGRLPSLVLPLQSLLAAAMLFTWLGEAHGIEVSLWPGWFTLGSMLLWLVLGQWLALRLTYLIADQWTPQSDNSERSLYEMLILFFQLPAILLYTLALGRQLA